MVRYAYDSAIANRDMWRDFALVRLDKQSKQIEGLEEAIRTPTAAIESIQKLAKGWP